MANKAVFRATALSVVAIISFWTRAAAIGPNTAPASAVGPGNQSDVIPAYASLWYKFDYAGDRSKVEITLQNGAVNNLGFNLYPPDQITLPNDYGSPIGKGTSQYINCDGGKCLSNDLLWAGDFFVGGTFYIQVMNQNSSDKPFAISVTGGGVTAHPYTPPPAFSYGYPPPPGYTYPNYPYPGQPNYPAYTYPTQPTFPNNTYPIKPAYPTTGYYTGQYAPYPPSGYSPAPLPLPAPIPYTYSPQVPSSYPQPGYAPVQYPTNSQSIPYNPTMPIGGCTYSVVPGDTLSLIAARFRTDTFQIASLNGLANPNLIFVGQRLYVPNCQ